MQIPRITHHPQAIKFLKILKELFSKSSLSGVRGNALHLCFKQTAPRRLFGMSKPSLLREGLLIHFFYFIELIYCLPSILSKLFILCRAAPRVGNVSNYAV